MDGFFESWEHGDGWEKISVKASDCPRISPEFLKDELAALGPMRFSEEYQCSFVDQNTSAFASALIAQALVDNFEQF